MGSKLSGFEGGMHKLEDILEKLADDDTGLDESIELYAQAAELIKQNHTLLKKAQVRIAEIDEQLREMEGED